MGNPYSDENPDPYGQPGPMPPSFGAPGFGPPASGQPYSGPPGYGGQPGYGAQPGYPGQPPYGGQPGYGHPGYGPPPGYGQPAYGQPYPQAFDPLTGQPLSDKSKVTAGLLQLLLGGIFVLGGVGRLYVGDNKLGTIQILATAIAWISFFCGFLFLIPFIVTFGCWVWFIVDGIMMLSGRPVDGQGRLLRS